jgi:hypothetical protein
VKRSIWSHRADARGGSYLLIPHRVLSSEAYRTASHRAKAVFLAILESFNGFNNGEIGVTMELIAERTGNHNHAANKRAIGELMARGLLAIEKIHPRGARKATEYRITFISSGSERRPVRATNDYEQWRRGDAGTVKKRPQPIARRSRLRVSIVDDERKASVPTIETDAITNGGISPDAEEPRVSITARHIVSHPTSFQHGASPAGTQQPGELSAAPALDELRRRVTLHVAKFGRGSQGRLAATAQIPEGTFSRFLRCDASLTPRARIDLACAFPKAEATERRLERTA